MKIDYSKWNSRLLSIDNLKLDIKNPRFSYQSTKDMNQIEIVKYLITNCGVYELAKDIAINGYLLNEQPIVCKEGNVFVVLEGNRRVAACKILLNPFKYLTPLRAKEISKYEKIKDKLDCRIAPNRREADTLIYNKHTGIPLMKWDKIGQDAFLVSLIQLDNLTVDEVAFRLNVVPSDIRKALRRYAIHQYCIEVFKDEPYELEQIQNQSFPITNFERFYDDMRGANFLGISFSSNGDIKKRLPKEEFDKRFKFIVYQILNQDLTSRSFNNEKDKDEYFAYINEFNKDKFDLDISPSEFIIEQIENNENTESTSSENNSPNEPSSSIKTKRSRRKPGLFSDYDWNNTGIQKLDSIFESLQTLNYKKHTDMAAITLRCYVDMLIYEFLLTQKKIGEIIKTDFISSSNNNDKKYSELKQYIKAKYAISDEEVNDEELRQYSRFYQKEISNKIPELGNMVAYIIKNPELFNNNTRLLQVLEKFKNSHNDFIDLKSCNMFVHNQYYSANGTSLEACANELAPFLEFMYLRIVNE